MKHCCDQVVWRYRWKLVSLSLSLSSPSLSSLGLPDEKGRLEILNIHTAKMRNNDKLDKDVDLEELAKVTRNFSGAEIEGLVRSATATAMNRMLSVRKRGEEEKERGGKKERRGEWVALWLMNNTIFLR